MTNPVSPHVQPVSTDPRRLDEQHSREPVSETREHRDDNAIDVPVPNWEE